MRRFLVVLSLLLLTACTRTDSDAMRVFEHAFGTDDPPAGVSVDHGYLWENRHLLVFYEEVWRLHLSGPSANHFVEQRWPDLKSGTPDYVAVSPETPWFRAGEGAHYSWWLSDKDPYVQVMRSPEASDVFIAYTAL